MARVKKPQPTLDALCFATSEQKVLRLLLSEPTTAFTPRVISSRLKGVRGLGGVEGITRILTELQSLGLADFVDNHRAVRLQDDNRIAALLKTFAAICDLESFKALVQPVSSKGILFGSRSTGKARSDSDYDLFVVSETPEEVRKIGARHPLGRVLELVVWTPEQYGEIERQDPGLFNKISSGVVLWGIELVKRKYLILASVSVLVVVLDQWTKKAVTDGFRLGESVSIIAQYFNLTYVRNTGAAFGLLAQANPAFRIPFFVIVPLVALSAIAMIFRRIGDEDLRLSTALSLVIGGAIGNLIDRLSLGYVVDFLDFHWKFVYHFPAFNVADTAICVGVGVLMLDLLKGDGDFAQMTERDPKLNASSTH